MAITVVSTRGQVVIPVEIRKKLNIKEGDVLSVHIDEGGRIVLKSQRKKQVKKGIVEKTAGLLSDMEMSGMEYVESIRRNQSISNIKQRAGR
ncbi:AbrB/MazE/SpoVT family DNA-binding domain-containing protein [Desulfofundulus thermobenzoicus]|uniref:AbrB/MazE/SpoVT family DNA-binding domain-containing protein n=1 Tax=Desulfofundulus thermobenzoicus TaxID=29376 RepID=A0A6N7INM9_9FIRM|nr:AbrB/MazE/SpoVT family DNA-binding domain-containing protein [Desulfofundulus thermobenzoicus]MQL51530.1 AbrB/MazE/SpoVT family DNA-binding domain-containing protein [Desulfofundulus thermobenzoicus]